MLHPAWLIYVFHQRSIIQVDAQGAIVLQSRWRPSSVVIAPLTLHHLVHNLTVSSCFPFSRRILSILALILGCLCSFLVFEEDMVLIAHPLFCTGHCCAVFLPFDAHCGGGSFRYPRDVGAQAALCFGFKGTSVEEAFSGHV